MNQNSIVFVIEPVYHGLQYIEILKDQNYNYVIIERKNGPYIIREEEVIYVKSLETEEILDNIKRYLEIHEYNNVGILPGNDFCVPIAFEVGNKIGAKTNPSISGILSRNKELMRKRLQSCNIPQPISNSYKTFDEIDCSKINFPVVVKPSDMTGSINVKLVYTIKELEEAVNSIITTEKNVLDYPHNNIVLIEEYVEGPEFSIELFLEENKLLFSSVTEKEKGELPYFVELGHVVPSSITTEEQNEILVQTAYQAAKAIEIKNGPVHAEIVLNNGIPKVIELTARIGGDNIMELVDLATGIYLPEYAIRQCLGEKIVIKPNKRKGAAIRFITSQPGEIVNYTDSDIQSRENVYKYSLNIPKNNKVNELTCSDDRLGYIIAIGKDGKTAKKNAHDAVQQISFIMRRE